MCKLKGGVKGQPQQFLVRATCPTLANTNMRIMWLGQDFVEVVLPPLLKGTADGTSCIPTFKEWCILNFFSFSFELSSKSDLRIYTAWEKEENCQNSSLFQINDDRCLNFIINRNEGLKGTTVMNWTCLSINGGSLNFASTYTVYFTLPRLGYFVEYRLGGGCVFNPPPLWFCP